ncbi:MAG TPA: TetR/AcrR family transcriptional regulator [Usitatibacter sp.]|nr:TetR/AcrR family transcriptional regulator [Usitatibacter sp.]
MTSTPARTRGRPRAFDRDKALAAAVEVFWRKGFEGTSISDLTEAMGINPPSLYAAFGDKEQLFLEAAESYGRKRGSECPYCDEPTARGAVEKLLTYMARELSASDQPRGCMMVNAAATSANASPRLQRVLAEKRAANREHMRARIKQGIADGDVPVDTDAGALADFYVTIMSGLSMQARDGASRKSLLATVERAMLVFPKRSKRKSAPALAEPKRKAPATA